MCPPPWQQQELTLKELFKHNTFFTCTDLDIGSCSPLSFDPDRKPDTLSRKRSDGRRPRELRKWSFSEFQL